MHILLSKRTKTMNQLIRNSLNSKLFKKQIHNRLYSNTSVFLRMASVYLINDSKYSFLKELGLSERNQGVFAKHGNWRGEGEIINSICPANNRPIASVVQGNEVDYEHCIKESVDAWKIWADVLNLY